MIRYKVGDLIAAAKAGEVNVIAHQANCFCTGKSGIAPLLFEAFPEMKKADDSTVKGDKSKLGKLSASVSPEFIGFNLYGQYHCIHKHPEYGTQYPALESSLKMMREVLDKGIKGSQPFKVGFPLIGCGLAGGDWEIVSKLITEAFEGFDGEVTVYTLKPVKGLIYDQVD